MKVFLTGGTGLVGSHVAELLQKEHIEVIAFVRKSADTLFLESLDIPVVYGDITDKDAIVDAACCATAIIHTAAKCADWGDYESFYNINIVGTINILEAARLNNIDNVIITGSISSYGEEHCLKKKDETSPFESHYSYFMDSVFPCKMNYYRDTKALAEKEAIAYAEKNGMNLTILEPTFIFGEREFHSGFYEYVKSVKDGSFVMPGSSANKFHVIYAGELAQAYLMALKKPVSGIERYLVGNYETDYMDHVFGLFCDYAELKKPLKLPKCLIYPIGFIMEFFYTLFKLKSPPLLTRGRVNMFYDNIEYNVEKIEKKLGFKTNMKLEESIKKTVKWYKDNKYL